VTGEEPVTASVDPTYWADPSILVVTPDGFSQPSPHRALETTEIAGIIEQYRAAALNAKKAGFDGVELMAANGHLIDQFLQDNSNKRTDRYGGSIENRARLLFEVAEALVSVWGPNRVGVRVAPSGTFNGMADSDPRALFRYVAERLNGLNLAYLHVIEPRIKGGELIAEGMGPVAAQELGQIFNGPVIAAGGFEPDAAEAAVASGVASLIAFGRHFIANPDLPKRIELGLPLNHYDRSTFYGFDARGYTDYPTYEASELAHSLEFHERTEREGRIHVLPRDLAMHAGAEEPRGLARQGGAACSHQEVRRRGADNRPPRARHEALRLPGSKRVRLYQGGRRLAVWADAA
jgi:N-ethylmaleimide reductase